MDKEEIIIDSPCEVENSVTNSVANAICAGNNDLAIKILSDSVNTGISVQASDAVVKELLSCGVDVVTNIASSYFESAVKVFEFAISRELERQKNELQSVDKAYEKYCDICSILISKVNFEDREGSEQALKFLEIASKDFEKRINATKKTSLLSMFQKGFRK